MSDSPRRESDDFVTVRLSRRAMNAVEEIRQRLGDVSPGEAVGAALGTELYLLRFANGDDSVIVEQRKGKLRQTLTVKTSGGNAGNIAEGS